MKKLIIVLMVVAVASFLFVGCITLPNQTPIITSDPITTATVGVTYTYDVEATDPDGDTLIYFLIVMPSGMTIGVDTGLIIWTPPAEGDYDVNVKVSDGDLDITQPFIITVAPAPVVPVAPTLTAIASPQIAYYGEVFTYTVVATAGTDPDLTFSLPVAPTMMSIIPATGVISWTPIVTQLGYNDVTVKVTAGDGLFDEASFIVEVREPILPEVELTSIVVSPEVMDLIVGDSETIILVTATYSDESTAVIALGDCTYLSDDEEVATVLAGLVTAVAAGEATITVSYGDESDTLAVTVSEPEPEPEIELTGIVVYPKTMDLIEGEEETITSVTATYEIRGTEVPIALGDCDYESDDEEIATVLAGVVTAVAEGTAIITVDYEGKTDTLEVTVSEPELVRLTSIVVLPEAMAFFVGGDPETIESVTAHYSDDTENVLDLADCDFASDDEDVAIVSDVGVVTAVAEGTATITVSYTEEEITKTVLIEETDTIAVTVSEVELDRIVVVPEIMTFDEDWIEDPLFEKTIESVTAHYNNGDEADVDLGDCEYGLSKVGIVNVIVDDNSVTVEPLAKGTATITVSYKEGDVTEEAFIEVTVPNRAPEITTIVDLPGIVDEIFTHQVVANDPDGDTLTYSLPISPPDMGIISTTGLISWTPDTAEVVTVEVEAFDGFLSAIEEFIITVTE